MTTIIIVQSKNEGDWNYCPKSAYESYFKNCMDYSDGDGFKTAQDALQAAQRDTSIPKGSQFEVQA